MGTSASAGLPRERRSILVVDEAPPLEEVTRLAAVAGRPVDVARSAAEAANWLGMRRYRAVVVALQGACSVDVLRKAARCPRTTLMRVTRGPSLAAPMESSIHDRLVATFGWPWNADAIAAQLQASTDALPRTEDLPRPLSNERGRVLLVEDDETDASLFELHLAECLEDWSAVRVSCLAEATRMLVEQRFDVVLTDLTLPDARGLDAVVKLRALTDAPPMVVLTGSEDERLAIEALRAGAQDFVCKSEVSGASLARAIVYAQERKRLERDLRRLANIDPLTQLANRSHFEDHLARAVATALRSRRKVTLLYIDLDGFKAVNDTLGHDVGDALLVEVGRRLASTLRESDFAARIGGDELAVVVEVDTPQQAVQAAERIRATLGRPYGPNPVQSRVSASIGIAMSEDASTPASLLASADRGMYRAKRSGGNSYAFENDTAVSVDGPSAADVRAALDAGELRLFYQPQFDAQSRPCGAEALLRWLRPDGTLVPPGVFLPALEASREMVAVGTWVLHTACQDAAELMRRGSSIRRIAVNVSARQLDDDTLLAAVRNALARCGLTPAQLEVEVTESAVMRRPEHAARLLAQLSQEGVRMAMDDFGTGYSSLANLHRLPFDLVKIDRAFVTDMHEPRCASVIRAILALARELELETLAEGVETKQQLQALLREGCNQIQGFYLGKPMPLEQLVEATQSSLVRRVG